MTKALKNNKNSVPRKIFRPLHGTSTVYFIFLCGPRPSKNTTMKSRSQISHGDIKRPWQNMLLSPAARPDSSEKENNQLMDSSLVKPTHYKNLSAWRLSVPRLYLRPELPGSSQLSATLTINVQRIDIGYKKETEESCWTVVRSHNDLYALASKLREFHGELEGVILPTRRNFSRASPEVLDSCREAFEAYLQALLQRPALQGSDLLYAFLSPELNFSEVVSESELSLGRVLRTVRLRKENGQHLDSFLQLFLTSVQVGKNKDTSPEDIQERKQRKARLHRILHQKSVTSSLNQKRNLPPRLSGNYVTVKGLFDCSMYFAVRILGIPMRLVQFGVALRLVFKKAVDLTSIFFLGYKMRKAMAPCRIVQLVRLIGDAVLDLRTNSSPRSPPSTEAGEHVIGRLEHCVPWPVAGLARTQIRHGLETVLAAMQNPRLSKQLAYTLLDILAEELFPCSNASKKRNL